MKIINKFNCVDVKGGSTWWEKKGDYIKKREKRKKQLKLMKKCDKKFKKSNRRSQSLGKTKKGGRTQIKYRLVERKKIKEK